jgi:hypothetical protein
MTTLQGGGTVEVQFPIFSQSAYTGNNSQYTIKGYATLKIVGWQFSGGGNTPFTYHSGVADVGSALACGGSTRCIIGQFVRFDAFLPSGGTGGQDFGTSNYSLIK